MRWTIYVDIDAFYVSCELRDRPELAGTPVIVGPDPKLGRTRGVVLSASYEARAFGVHSAQPVAQADRLCPAATWLPADFRKYGRISEEVRAYLAPRGDRAQPLSIDEVALELADVDQPTAEARAREIQQGLRSELRLPASLGVATDRTVAKIASDRAKPGGIVTVPPDQIAAFLAPLSVRAIPGVGPKTAERLAVAGITTIADFRRAPPGRLRAVVGGFSHELIRLAEGHPLPRSTADEAGPRSRSAARTLVEDIDAAPELRAVLEELSAELTRSLREEGLTFQTVTVGVRWSDFTRTQRGRTLRAMARTEGTLAAEAARLWAAIWAEEGLPQHRRVRTLSITASHLTPGGPSARSLEMFVDDGPRAPPHRAARTERPP
jgi:nucleotidyltransferase/DNA polymerase involved in DNA repair